MLAGISLQGAGCFWLMNQCKLTAVGVVYNIDLARAEQLLADHQAALSLNRAAAWRFDAQHPAPSGHGNQA
jgi:hypothetical protein